MVANVHSVCKNLHFHNNNNNNHDELKIFKAPFPEVIKSAFQRFHIKIKYNDEWR